MSQDFKTRVQRDGFAVIPACLDETTLESLSTEFNDSHHPERNLLSIQSIQALAKSSSVREIMETILGPECFAVRGIFFNKTRTSNWKVAWHQDLTIAVRERKNVEGFGPWTMKAGVLHVQPPCEVMAGMLAIRLHLDESGCDNGPLRVIAGSHMFRLKLRPSSCMSIREHAREWIEKPAKGVNAAVKTTVLAGSSSTVSIFFISARLYA
jgi:ectoine hydroxylase-related dioxygenase (phytanoyl-CoA dioxygenase family)